MKLHAQVSLALAAGAVAGALLGGRAGYLEPLGTAFVRLISMVIVPLVFSGIVASVAGPGETRKLGKIGATAIVYFVLAMASAILLGMLLAGAIEPGAGLPEGVKASMLESYRATAAEQLRALDKRPSPAQIILDLIPANPLKAAADANLLQLIFFALALGISARRLADERRAALAGFFQAVADALIIIVSWIVRLAPIGVFALIAAVVGRFGLSLLLNLARFSLLVIVGLLLHIALVYAPLVKFYARRGLIDFLRGIAPAQALAFGTTSSAATLPVSMRCARQALGLSDEVTSFVLPLGASLSRDGTAVYQAISALFIAQVYGLELGVERYLAILLVGTLASLGTAAVPGGGFINLAIILRAAGIPLEGLALVLGVDRILDMCRTAVNVTGQLCGAVLVDSRSRSVRTALVVNGRRAAS